MLVSLLNTLSSAAAASAVTVAAGKTNLEQE